MRRVALMQGVAAVAVASLAVEVPAFAQDRSSADAQNEITEEQAQAIIITGSRLVQRGQTSSPVTTIGADEVKNLALTSAADIVGMLPQNSNFISPDTTGGGGFFIAASLANLRGLNPYFGSRTLTLIDGRRHVPTTYAGGVDLNVVPSSLVSRVETVTGGGSAVYGSEAVAGVVNILIDKKMEGLKADVDYGFFDHGGGDDWHGSIGFGTHFAQGRGSFIIGAEYNKAGEVRCSDARSICTANYATFTNLNYGGANGPRYTIGSGARNLNSDNGMFFGIPTFLSGVVFPPPVAFNTAGTALAPIDLGNPKYLGFFPGANQGGADATQDVNRTITLRPQSERTNILAHSEYEFSPALTGWVEGSWYKNKTVSRSPQTGRSIFAPGIAPDNYYFQRLAPAEQAKVLAFLGPTGIPFSSNGQWMPERVNNTRIQVWTAAAGVKGKITDRWSFDAYYSFGDNSAKANQSNITITDRYDWQTDAVDNGSGTPVCRVTLSNPTSVLNGAGCIPMNPFGQNFSQAAFDYSRGTLTQAEKYRQHVAALNVQGELFGGFGAGPVQLGVGGEYRKETLGVTHDVANKPWFRNFEIYYGEDFFAGLEAYEGYSETNIPLLRDLPFAKALTAEAAVRFSHYKNTETVSGTSRDTNFTTWKLSGIWEINDWLRLRGSRSRDVRAATLFELYSLNITSRGFFASVDNPWDAIPNFSTEARIVNGGYSTNLRPEVANTVTLGGVVTGRGALNGVYASVDWFQVDIEGAIGRSGQAWDVVGQCFISGTNCELVKGTNPVPAGTNGGVGPGFLTITEVDNPHMNLGRFVTRGLDMELGYRYSFGETQSVSLRVIGTYLYDLLIDNGDGIVRQYAGISGPSSQFGSFNTSPKWQANAFVTYADKMFTATVQGRYIGKGKFGLLAPDPATQAYYIDPSDPGYDASNPGSISSNRLPAALYLNLNASVKLPIGNERRNVELFGNVNNLLDKDPPAAPGGVAGTNPVYFDQFGRSFRFGIRVQY
jgi:iron complex outermembrane receptor protein